MVVGTAEGGMKITLYNVNDIDPENIDVNMLNEYYFPKLCIMSLRIFCIKPRTSILPLNELRRIAMLAPTGISRQTR